MDENDRLADRFEEHRSHLRAVAYRMLGSRTDADDAVQEAWLRFSGADTAEVENLRGWLTTVVSRVCLNVLRSRATRREEALEPYVPDPVVGAGEGAGPEQEALLADAVGLALLVVLDTLPPAERLAFVLHDMFAVPFDDIAPILGRSTAATRQLASRARRRVQGSPSTPDADLTRQREVVDAFFAAARGGDFEALVSILDPDIVLRSDAGPGSPVSGVLRGAPAIAGQAMTFADPNRVLHAAVVNGAAGVVVTTVRGRVLAVIEFTVAGGRIVAIDALSDLDRLRTLDVRAFEG
jgi:RNA polymerase sigma-70 factor (ECF subfamily)